MWEIYKHCEGVLKDTGFTAMALHFNGRFSIKSLFIVLEQYKQLPSFISGGIILPPQSPSLICVGQKASDCLPHQGYKLCLVSFPLSKQKSP